MNFRMARRREGIVSLTHTEIMLVLMTIIILLLLAKSFALSKSEQDRERAEQPVELLAGAERKSEPREQKPVDLAAEIVGMLVREGVGVDDPSSEALVEAVRQQVGENRQRKAREAAIARALEKAGGDPKQDGKAGTTTPPFEDQLEALAEKAAVGEAVREALGEEQMDPETARSRIAGLQANELKGKIGFVPCWLGPGQPKYYGTYSVTYIPDKDRFAIEPHTHWNSGAQVVDHALQGNLSILKDYPKRRVTPQKFLAFGRDVEKSRKQLYGNDCHLAVTLNKDNVDGNIVEFIRDQVRFWPIYR